MSCEEVRRIISSLPLNKSPGPDEIHTRVYRDCLPAILGLLTEIINSSLESAKYPDAWKFAEIIPLLKEGDHEVASNYRPLSLLAVASKICDKVVLNQFSAYLISNGRLSSHQSGNKKLHSTETLSLFMAYHLLEAMYKKNLTALTLLDLSKAFDSLNHNKLLAKLSSVGASPHVVNWFKSYLTGRSQSVRINSILSDPLPITHGVPQGAILSPFLFCIYLNDLICAPQVSGLESYVDNSKVFLSFSLPDIDTAIANLEQDLMRVAAWCCENQLLINPDKTKFMLSATRQLRKRFSSSPVVSFLSNSSEPVASAKDLSVTLDSRLTYDCHISNVVSSCMAKLCQINRVKNSFDEKTLEQLISSLVLSKMLYCSTVWSNISTTNIKKLQLVQNFACKIVTKTRKFDHVTPLLRELNWLSVDQLLFFRATVMTYKCMNHLAPSYLSSKFVKRSDIHNRRTRNREALQIPFFRSASGQRSFAFRGARLWNSISPELRQCASLKAVKEKLESHSCKQLLVLI